MYARALTVQALLSLSATPSANGDEAVIRIGCFLAVTRLVVAIGLVPATGFAEVERFECPCIAWSVSNALA